MALRTPVGVPEPVQTIECLGVRLATSRQGRGPTVVCLHAIGHGGRDFDALAAALVDRFEVIRIDWPGHGRSGPDTEPPSAARYAALLAATLAHLGVRDPILLGNSIGGAAAILHATRQPVRALVLCDSGGLVKISAPVRLFVRFFTWFFGAGERGARWFARAFAIYYRRIVLPARPAAAQRERIIASAHEIAPLLRQAWQGFGASSADIRAQAAALTVPIWCAWSRRDRVIPLWLCRPAIRRMRNVRLTTFRGGHAAFLEDPEAFARAFVTFAGDLPKPAGQGQSAAGPLTVNRLETPL